MARAIVVAPETTQDLAAALADAQAQGQAVVPWGYGTRQHIGCPPARHDITLETTRLSRIVEHVPADLTVTVEAGITLASLQDHLRPHGQWLPWDPPDGGAGTVGGLLASGASGPLRLAYGTPRDWTLGMQVALPDGRLVRSGGRVVKNVSGYDMHKLHLGALGTLGVIVEVTFKVAPVPPLTGSVVASFPTLDRAIAAGEQLRRPPLAPFSLAVLDAASAPEGMPLAGVAGTEPGHGLLAAGFAGSPAAVNRQIRAAVLELSAAGARVVELAEEECRGCRKMLSAFAAPVPQDTTLLVRAGARPAAIGAVLTALGGVGAAQRVGYPGVGLAYARIPAPDVALVRECLGAVRQAVGALGGYVVVEAAPAAMHAQLDVWGPPPATIDLMRSLRTQYDPQRTLNPGRYLVP